eukprot:jgi/Chlat1/4714/Chrsp30S04766
MASWLLLSILSLLLVASATAKGEGKEVTIGSVVKFVHDKTGYRLHSHEINYGSGSGQQSVTGFSGGDDTNSYWVVHLPNGITSNQGDKVEHGTVIRLQHLNTRRWLHSHGHASPISNQYEVSGFGDDNNSDTGDVWKLELDKGKGVWERGQKVRFLHVEMSAYLGSHDKKYPRPIAGQQEVCGMRKKSADTNWVATEGVYFAASPQ